MLLSGPGDVISIGQATKSVVVCMCQYKTIQKNAPCAVSDSRVPGVKI